VSAFKLIAAERANRPVDLLCELLGVSRSGSMGGRPARHLTGRFRTRGCSEQIKQIYADNRGVYGEPRIHAELRLGHGVRVGRKRVERLVRQASVSGLVPRRRGRTTIRVPGVRVAADLVERDFRPAAPNVLWVADITYLRCGGLALPRRRPGRLQSPHRRLEHGGSHALRARRRRAADGPSRAGAPRPG
jgi:putative transposase